MAPRVHRPFLATPRPLCFAHRGGAARWPENSLLAFRQTIETGCDVVETDVHLTRDGQIVTLHDERLERTTNGHGRVRDHTLSELRRLDAGYRFSPAGGGTPLRGQGLVIPTLAELVELSPHCRFNLDLKPPSPALVRALWQFVEQRGLHERVLVASQHHENALAFRRLSQDQVATSASYREILLFWAAVRWRLHPRLRPRFDALQVPLRHSGLTVVDARFVAAAHELGLHVHVWTLNTPTAMRQAIALGVDGVMSDYPGRLLRVVGRGRRSGRAPHC